MKRENPIKRKLAVGLVFVFLMSLVGGSSVYASGNMNGFFGSKSLEEDDWGSLDSQPEIGFKMDFKNEDWPVSLAGGIFVSVDEEDGYDPLLGDYTRRGSTVELAFGVKKIWGSDIIHPFLGGGLALVTATMETEYCDPWFCSSTDVYSDDDTALGLWLDVGVYLTLNERINLGLNLRWSKAEVTLWDVDREAGGTHIGLLVGYHFY